MGYVTTYFLILILVISYVQCKSTGGSTKNVKESLMLKYLMEMVNKTTVDNPNLPANATSIRENITDTFSCENRPYGYYADVDNECQVFHVCFTMHSNSSGRNTTYQWSFICPKHTVFNQLALTCTYPKDSIKCEDSPNYYDLNLEIGKTPNDTETSSSENGNNKQPSSTVTNDKNNVDGVNNDKKPSKTHPDAETIPVKKNKRGENRKKQNIVIENKQEAKTQDLNQKHTLEVTGTTIAEGKHVSERAKDSHDKPKDKLNSHNDMNQIITEDVKDEMKKDNLKEDLKDPIEKSASKKDDNADNNTTSTKGEAETERLVLERRKRTERI